MCICSDVDIHLYYNACACLHSHTSCVCVCMCVGSPCCRSLPPPLPWSRSRAFTIKAIIKLADDRERTRPALAHYYTTRYHGMGVCSALRVCAKREHRRDLRDATQRTPTDPTHVSVRPYYCICEVNACVLLGQDAASGTCMCAQGGGRMVNASERATRRR